MIFLSYREADSESFVLMLEKELESVFGPERVFRDKKRLTGSVNWQKDLFEKGLEKADVLLAVIGSNWQLIAHDATRNPDKAGMLRLQDEDDWVRRELLFALGASQRESNPMSVFVILHDSTVLPAEGWLKRVQLEGLLKPQAHRMRGADFDAHFSTLCEILATASNGYRDAVDAWKRQKQSKNPVPAVLETNLLVTQYLHSLVSQTSELKLPGLGTHPRISLPISDAYFPLQGSYDRSVMVEPRQRGERPEDVGDRCVELQRIFAAVNKSRGVVVLGEPGSGKTTLARRLAWTLARKSLGEHTAHPLEGLPDGIRPVFLRLRNLTPEICQSSQPLQDLLALETQPAGADEKKTDLASLDRATCNALLASGPLLWIFDGLDEVADSERRRQISEALRRLAASATQGPRANDRYLVTSRFAGYYDRGVPLGDQFFDFRILALSFPQTCDFIRLWFPAAYARLPGTSVTREEALAKADQLIQKLTERQAQQAEEHSEEQAGSTQYRPGRGLFNLVENPLMLTIVCMVYDHREDLPENRAKLYEQALQLMLVEWRKGQIPFDPEAAKRVLGRLAWWLQQEKNRVLGPQAALAAEAAVGLRALNPDTSRLGTDGQQFLDWMRDPIGILAFGGAANAELGFLHRCFQEYLAAQHAVQEGYGARVAEVAEDDWWFELALLALRNPGQFTRDFFAAALKRRLPAEHPGAVSHFVTEAVEIPFETVKEYLERQALCVGLDSRGRRIESWWGRWLPQQMRRESVDSGGIKSVLNFVPWSEERRRAFLPVLEKLRNKVDASTQSKIDEVIVRLNGEARPTVKVEATGSKAETAPQLGTKRYDDRTQLSLVWIPPGAFTMGSPNGDGRSNEQPAHHVTLTQGFWLGEFPVTNEQFAVFLRTQAGKSHQPGFWNDRLWNQPRQPVVAVSWLDAMAYCNWVSQQLGETCTLPSEAQWEYACRAGNSGKWCFGNDEEELRNFAWFDENSEGRTQPVGTKQPNAWGLHDMHGNVWEWCRDRYEQNAYQGRAKVVVNPVVGDPGDAGDSNARRVLRGGSWLDSAGRCRSAFRFSDRADCRDRFFGFRVALVPGPFVPPQKTKGKGP